MINHKHSFTESKTRAIKAVLMSGRVLDMTHPSSEFKWAKYSKQMIDLWENQEADFQMMVTLEADLVMYCHEELVDYVNFYITGGRR